MEEEANDIRHYENPYNDYNPNANENIYVINGKVVYTEHFLQQLKSAVINLQQKMSDNLQLFGTEGYSVYTGLSGLNVLDLLLWTRFQDNAAFSRLLQTSRRAVKHVDKDSDRVSFLNGDAGMLAISAIAEFHANEKYTAQKYIYRLLDYMTVICEKRSMANEVLYGRAGYLYSLLFLQIHMSDNMSNIHPRRVIDLILDTGMKDARESKHKAPLMYHWHGKEYIGAAHGYIGILYTLLMGKHLLTEVELNDLIKPTLDYLLTFRYQSGNFRSSTKSRVGDLLVHWCHGAPGAAYLYAAAYQVYHEERYLQVALDCGEVVWKRGILQKGYSLCHGVAGNAYTFLALFQLTKDLKHLHRATKFAEWCFHYGLYQKHNPDRLLSLYEGIVGVIYFLLDLQDPWRARMPGFQL